MGLKTYIHAFQSDTVGEHVGQQVYTYMAIIF